MTRPQSGDTVRVQYTGRLDDGRIFASSRAQGPLKLTVEEARWSPASRRRSRGSLVRQGDEVVVMSVADVSDEQVTIDANHPLAGENLTFDLELVEIRRQQDHTGVEASDEAVPVGGVCR